MLHLYLEFGVRRCGFNLELYKGKFLKLSTFLWMVFFFSVLIGKNEMVKIASETQSQWLGCYTPVLIKALQWGCSCPSLINLYLCPAQLLFTAICYQETMAWSLVWFSVVSHLIPSNNVNIWKGVYFPTGRLCAVYPVIAPQVRSPQARTLPLCYTPATTSLL